MGLMYIFPVEENEIDDRLAIEKKGDSKTLVIKNYGLPMVFWGYLAAAMIVMLFMFLAVKGPLFTMIEGTDSINKAIAFTVLALFILGPIILLGFFFYEKRISKSGNRLKISHRVFWLPFKSKSYDLKAQDSFIVGHYMSSPNVAKMKSDPNMRGFENKGYFELWMTLSNEQNVLLDRHSRKIDLTRISELLSKY